MLNQIQGIQLSPQQKRVWSIQRNSQDSVAQCVISLQGILDVHALQQAIKAIVARHQILCATFYRTVGMHFPIQTIPKSFDFFWQVIDMRGLSLDTQEKSVTSLIQETRNLSFDFERGSLLHAYLLALGEKRHCLIISLPALCADSWSLDNVVREVSQFYEECLNGRMADDGSKRVLHYFDFSEWQNSLFEDEEAENGQAFWRSQHIDKATELRLTFEVKQAPTSPFNPVSVFVGIDSDLTIALSERVAKNSTSIDRWLFACWQILLWRHTRHKNTVIYHLLNSRVDEALYEGVGLFATVAPIPISVTDSLTFWQVLDKVQKVVDNAHDWQAFYGQETNYAAAVDHANTVAITFENYLEPFKTTQLTFRVRQRYVNLHQFKLKLHCVRQDNTLRYLEFHYDPVRFSDADIARLAEEFHTLLHSTICNPEARINELNIVGANERQKLIATFNDTETPYLRTKCVHQLFEEQVVRTPNKTAVYHQDTQITYAQLNERANQVAHYLQICGVQADTIVGLYVTRSLEMIIGLLGILKAGGAYLPLDVTYPQERLTYIVEDAGVSFLLTQGSLIHTFKTSARKIINLDSDWENIAQYPESNPTCHAVSDNLAYIIYTSGSTGRPKGVMIPHQGVVNYLSWAISAYTASAGQGTPVHSPLGFDLTVTSLLAPLLAGQTIFLLPEDHDLEALTHFIRTQEDLSLVKITPTHLKALNQLLTADRIVNRVNTLVIGGEALYENALEIWRTHAPHTRLINEYGPTEAVVGCCTYEVPNEQRLDEASPIPIGKPIANAYIYLLDSQLKLVPIGVAGEIYIGGHGLARGYHNRTGLTASQFIPDPLSDVPGARLYKSGDLALYRPDGNLVYLGRTDHQVKVRGFRIELGEIEATLLQHTAVRDAVLITYENQPDNIQIIAYVVPEQEPPSVGELRTYLGTKLPAHMIPAAFIMLPKLPRTANAKVDREALPRPKPEQIYVSDNFIQPRTPLEEMITTIWASVLDHEHISVHDNFFQMGGHSLLATQIVARIREIFQIEVSVRDLFETPTIAALAASLANTKYANEHPTIPALLPTTKRAVYPLSFAQQRLWFLDQLQPGNTAYNIAAVVSLKGTLHKDILLQSLNEIVRRHDILRTTFKAVNGRPQQIIAPTLTITQREIDLRNLALEEQAEHVLRLAEEEAQRPFDLKRGPLLRTTLIQRQNDEYMVFFTIHHTIADGWSMSILIRELMVLYEAYNNGDSSPLPELTIQYTDYACWQREWLQGDMLSAQLAYWKKQFGKDVPVLDLPIDAPFSIAQQFRGNQLTHTLCESLTTQLKALCRSEAVTLFMILLTTFNVLLQRYSEQDDIVVGTPIAGRSQAAMENLIGCFVNTLALRTDLSGNPSFRELLRQIREVTLAAYIHQDLPFEKLVEALDIERNLSRTPLFDVFFNFVNTPRIALELSQLTVEQVNLVEPEAKFAITLYVEEVANQLYLRLVYREDLFTEARMTQMLQQFQLLLEQIVINPDRPIQTYSLVFTETTTLPNPAVRLPEPVHPLVTEMITDWAARLPQQVAIRQGDQEWQYSELVERAQHLARLLLASGLKPGDVVVIEGMRSFGMIATMLATWWSGGCLLMLDRHLPLARQQVMVDAAQAKYLIHIKKSDDVETAVFTTQSTLHHFSVLALTGFAHTDQPIPTVPLPPVTGDDAAYIFFTSGTTGTPKGVVGCHKGLSHFLSWQRSEFNITPQDRCAQLTALSFDVVLRDIFLALVSGATLCLPEDDYFDPNVLLPWLDAEKISVIHTVPTLAQSWLTNAPEGVSLQSLRWAFFAGEPLTNTLIQRWRQSFPQTGDIVNLYGPTETTLAKCFYVVPEMVLPGVQPIGRPLPETEAIILNRTGQLCGINEVGEIVLRTPFRSLGYVNGTDEDNQRFVVNPFRQDPQDILYYTGDRGRYKPDGVVEILGRRDHQIKIRGMRVEPGEIEAAICRHVFVQQATVIMYTDNDNMEENRLAAYFVAWQQLAPSELRRFLKESLPDYMIPAVLMQLEALPTTPNGKINRRELPSPLADRTQLDVVYMPPQTQLEHTIAAVWRAVLSVAEIGIHDNFFDLGGHSLSLIEVQSRLQKELPFPITAVTLFQYPTISTFAHYISQDQQKPQTYHESRDRAAMRRQALQQRQQNH